jgi:dipeptidyl aminopeptidase/acylaminoacyl peptidase
MMSGISRDERWVALLKIRNNADNDLHLFDTTTPGAELVHVTPHEGDVSHGAQDFSPDSRSFLYTSNEGSEFQRLWAFDLATATRRPLEEAKWDIMYSVFSRNGKHRVTGINADARTQLRVASVESGEAVELPAFPRGDITGVTIARSGDTMAFYVNGSTSPSNLYVLDMASGMHRRLTSSLNPRIDEKHLVEAEVVRYPSFDGQSIPALLYRPHGASAERRVPALVWVHGGPGGQSRYGYRAVIQLLANHGYAILAVNNRGSSGYGKTFFHLDDRRHGEDDLQDCVRGRRYLEGLPWIDGERVGIMGGSYGGYMVAAAMAFEPEAFDVGIDIFGVTNWLRTLESIPIWWTDFRDSLYAEMGDPATDRERLHRISPLFHASNIARPLLVVQGANDPRVLQVESDELVAAVRDNGVPVEYVVFEDEGHGFRSRGNRIAAADAYVEFLERYLRGN